MVLWGATRSREWRFDVGLEEAWVGGPATTSRDALLELCLKEGCGWAGVNGTASMELCLEFCSEVCGWAGIAGAVSIEFRLELCFRVCGRGVAASTELRLELCFDWRFVMFDVWYLLVGIGLDTHFGSGPVAGISSYGRVCSRCCNSGGCCCPGGCSSVGDCCIT